ncbi:hypothetical protein D9V30_10610 [Mycetocola reblochoni]|uniref:Large exoprotein n=1 Tax=Mycetocola reblochoni TaxID=331618 RepID=A0A3L6ZKQ9_9MICO|nr:hypothetical protein D9V30_10610 [Mycetocola reblochoni]
MVFALVVLLWFVCLIPGLRRQHQYRATARNAERLQRTMRVLAEGADGPTEVTVDASREQIAEQKRILRDAELREGTSRRARRAAATAAWRDRRARAAAARTERDRTKDEERRQMQERQAQERLDAATDPVVAARVRARDLAASRRRARLVATALLLVSFPLIGAGVAAVAGGAGAGLLVSGLVVAVAAASALARMAVVAERSARRPMVVVATDDVAEAATLYDQDEGRIEAPRVATHRPLWDSAPLPDALQSTQGSLADETLSRVEAQEALRQAALAQVMAEMASARQADIVQDAAAVERARRERAERDQAERDAVERAEAGRAAVEENPFAQMGRVGEYDSRTDVSDILRRRRNAG